MEKKVMTKKRKGHQIFGQEKCTPAEKILATPMQQYTLHQSVSRHLSFTQVSLPESYVGNADLQCPMDPCLGKDIIYFPHNHFLWSTPTSVAQPGIAQ